MLVFTLLACGGPAALPQPQPPPEWPLENMHVKKKPVEAEAETKPEAPPTDEEKPSSPSPDTPPTADEAQP